MPPFVSNTKPLPDRPEIVPPMVYLPVVHETATLVTLALATVPLPPAVTPQVCAGLECCENTVTLKVPPLAMAVVNVKLPFALTDRLLPPLSCNTSPVPARPVIVPPMV